MSDGEELLDIAQAAQFLNVSETSLRRWTNSGRLACLRVGQKRERRFRRSDLLAFMEDQPVVDERANHSDEFAHWRVRDGVSVPQGTHTCALYETDEGRDKQAVEFLGDGLRLGSACYLVAAPESRASVLRYLARSRPAFQQDIDAGRLVLTEYAASAQAQYDAVISSLAPALERGVHSLRVVGDVVDFREKTSDAELLNYESNWDAYVSRRLPVITLCMYDVRAFTGLAILGALKGHLDTFRYPTERYLP
jgi:transcriptional repressor of dcmA and dcmR